MASPEHPTTMENLPDELLINIFIRLFAKQLAQMRSVSKTWNSLLSQPSFMKSHLDHSIHNNDQILLVFYDNMSSSSDSKRFTAHPSRSPHLELTEFNILLPINPENGSTEKISVIGAVNGLICSSYGDSVVHIWNPSLSAFLTLPPCPMPSRNSYEINLWFGYDPKNDDYKVLKILAADDFDYGLRIPTERRQVEVFSMRKGSWEDITQWFPSHIYRIAGNDSVCVDGNDGHLRWFGFCFSWKTKSTLTQPILAFDLGSNTFSEIPFPVSTRNHDTENLLGVLARKLCVMAWHDNDVCEVWVMEEYGVAESWVRRHVFSQSGGDTYPFGFTSHNEFLFEGNHLIEDKDQRLVLYDPIANKTKNFEKSSCSRSHHPRTIVEYVDSLVWVAPAKYEMVDGGGQN